MREPVFFVIPASRVPLVGVPHVPWRAGAGVSGGVAAAAGDVLAQGVGACSTYAGKRKKTNIVVVSLSIDSLSFL